MSALGLTIDYGPYQFMEYFNPELISNHSDTQGRYNYENQPSVCKWNLIKLCEALDPLVDIKKSTAYVNDNYDELYSAEYLGTMGKKLGFLTELNPLKSNLTDLEFECIQKFVKVLTETRADFTNTFRLITLITRDPLLGNSDKNVLEDLIKQCAPMEAIMKSSK